MNLATILICLGLIVLIFLAVRYLIRHGACAGCSGCSGHCLDSTNGKDGGACSGGCAHCSHACGHSTRRPPD